MVPFQCDVYHFRNIQKRNPDPLKYAKDALALSCIRRANLDSVWSREPSTVSRNASQAHTMKNWEEHWALTPLPLQWVRSFFGRHFWHEDRLCHLTEIIGSWKMGKHSSVCHGEKDEKRFFEFISCLLPRRIHICNGLRDAKNVFDAVPDLWVLVSKI